MPPLAMRYNIDGMAIPTEHRVAQKRSRALTGIDGSRRLENAVLDVLAGSKWLLQV